MREYVEQMTKQDKIFQAQEALQELFSSYLYENAGWTIDAAAECYDEMNDNQRYQSALSLIRQLHNRELEL